MLYWVGITDKDWFEALRQRQPDEVNFWSPSPQPARNMEPGWPFLFKLHAPDNYVVGGGHFIKHTVLPCSLAWDAFGENNGVSSLDELVRKIGQHQASGAKVSSGTEIGCNLLIQPFFLDEEDWIPIPSDWKPPTQKGRTYDTEKDLGRGLWEDVKERLVARLPISEVEESRRGSEYLVTARLGQGTFRILVTDAYHGRCAVTGERSLPALDAAHIKAHSEKGPNQIQNGLLLRADVHRLFDKGYVTVDPEYEIRRESEVARRV